MPKRLVVIVAGAVLLPLLALATLSAKPWLPQQEDGYLALQRLALSDLQSPKWEVRYKGVNMLLKIPAPHWSVPVREQILRAYASELGRINRNSQGLLPKSQAKMMANEGYAEYLGYLGSLVMEVGGDRALKLLIESPSQPMADSNRQLAAYGARVLPLVLQRLSQLRTFRINAPGYHGADVESQMAMADILAQMIKLDEQHKLHPSLTPSDCTRITEALRPLLGSKNDYVRLDAALGLIQTHDNGDAAAIRSIFLHFLSARIPGERSEALDKIASSVDDPRFVPLPKVRELAASDLYHYKQGTLGTGPVVYPVRDAARKVLNKFSKRSAPSAVK